MTMKSLWARGLFAALCAGILFTACEYEGPEAVWNPNQNLGAFPTIARIDPGEKAEAGVLEIGIVGSNFSSDSTNNVVYFNKEQAIVKSCTDSLITVYRPNIFGTGISIHVVVQKEYLTANYTAGYDISQVVRSYGNVSPNNIIQTLAADREDNLYFFTITKTLIKVDTNESRTQIGTRTFKPKSTDAKIGPDGSIFVQALTTNSIHVIPPEGGDSQLYANLAVAVSYFDFDANGNIFAGGNKKGVCVLTTDLQSRVVGNMEDLNIVYLKVYGGYVYAADATAIYKSQIQSADGTLGDKQKVFDITTIPAYASSKILSFAISEDGVLYISTNHADAVFLYHPADGSTQPMYLGILPANGGQLVWGHGTYLYLSQTQVSSTNNIIRIDTGKREAGK
jgi:hypothetical protein